MHCQVDSQEYEILNCLSGATAEARVDYVDPAADRLRTGAVGQLRLQAALG